MGGGLEGWIPPEMAALFEGINWKIGAWIAVLALWLRHQSWCSYSVAWLFPTALGGLMGGLSAWGNSTQTGALFAFDVLGGVIGSGALATALARGSYKFMETWWGSAFNQGEEARRLLDSLGIGSREQGLVERIKRLADDCDGLKTEAQKLVRGEPADVAALQRLVAEMEERRGG